MMTSNAFLLAALALLMSATAAYAQQPAATPPTIASAEVMQCAQAQMIVDRLLSTANTRLETARQANSAAEMRAAVDELQATLRDVGAQLAPCASIQPAGDPHAGHTMPNTAASPAPPGTPAMKPGSTPPAKGAPKPSAADPHAGHTTAPAKPAGMSNALAQSDESRKIEEWLKQYDAAFVAKDLDKLATFYHPDVTVYEGAGVNNGWADYRDRHLGPELKTYENLEFGHLNRRVTMLGDHAAYVISQYFIKGKMKDRILDHIGRETLVVEKQADGAWKIRHSHTSGRARALK
jgi:ketosteroid isomerase-like protein